MHLIIYICLGFYSFLLAFICGWARSMKVISRRMKITEWQIFGEVLQQSIQLLTV